MGSKYPLVMTAIIVISTATDPFRGSYDAPAMVYIEIAMNTESRGNLFKSISQRFSLILTHMNDLLRIKLWPPGCHFSIFSIPIYLLAPLKMSHV